ncbi:MAG: hypothetical protein D6696_17925 [Acidobacteria bacterium]|nr:MAG: hypothetical protein D6696_17925 [Acidobacteriota bacterium]
MRSTISPRARISLARLGPLLALLIPGALAADWRPVPAPVGDDLHAVFFLDRQRGWIVTHRSGKILHTGDGGETWRVQAEVGEGVLEWIVFSDRQRGWMCGDGGRIYRTSDGGETWQEGGSGEAKHVFRSLYFTSPRRGLALGVDAGDGGRAIVFETVDGGVTWEPREAPAAGRGFTGALAVLDDRIAVAGGSGTLYRTEDGGHAWSAIRIDGPADEPPVVRGLSFADVAHGWAVGDRGLIARSDDGGRSWRTTHPVSRFLLRGVLFVDPQNGFIVGQRDAARGLLYATTDGGEHWRSIAIDHPPLHRLTADGERLWIVGGSGTILWRPMPAPPAPEPPAAAEPPAAGTGDPG